MKTLDELKRRWLDDVATGRAEGWYRAGVFGSSYDGPQGPWRDLDEAYLAVARWVRRKGSEAGSRMAASSFRVLGPFRTREQARQASISETDMFVDWSRVVDHAAERGILLGRG